MISTVPDGGSTIVNADANGKFSAELARTAGTYTEVSAAVCPATRPAASP